MRDLGRGLPKATAKPGLTLIATHDFYCGGESFRAELLSVPGPKWLSWKERWRMCQQPKQAAEAINAFLVHLN